jgi:AbrB family looped-hinge helix DNA binding protein
MNTTKVTTQGTISLPIALRRKFSVMPGDTLSIFERQGEIIITKTPDIAAVRLMNKKYLKNFNLENYKNGDGMADYVIEKYGKK